MARVCICAIMSIATAAAKKSEVSSSDSIDPVVRITIAGPLRTEDNQRSTGAIIIFEADSLDDAQAVVDADPYVSQGVFGNVDVSRFRQALPSTP